MANPYIGEIKIFAGTFAILHYTFCNGTLMAITQNEALYSLLGTNYGGDGRTSFGLPDLRGRVAMHTGSGPGLTPRLMGQMGGSEEVALTVDQIPSHNHQFYASSTDAQTETITGNMIAPGTGINFIPGDKGTLIQFNSKSIETYGGDGAHDNLIPSLAVNYIIALHGVFPPRN